MYGVYCEFCVFGLFGNVIIFEGCKLCQCNGYGDLDKYFCNMIIGQCYCIDFIMGFYCDKCMWGFMGNLMQVMVCLIFESFRNYIVVIFIV